MSRPRRRRRLCGAFALALTDPSPPRKAWNRSTRVLRSAGTSPDITAAATDAVTPNSSVVPSRAMASRRGKRAGAASGSSRTSVHARARPAAPPAADRTRLSVRSCRTSRVRLPPSAARIVNSRWRAAPRESSRFAMFAQAMSSTRATALASTRIAGRTVSVRSSTSGRARTTTAPPRPKKNSVDGGRGMLRAAAVPSASACAAVMPVRSRPSVVNTTVRFA